MVLKFKQFCTSSVVLLTVALKAAKTIFAKNTNSLRAINPIGEPFYELSEVDSTNNYAMQQAQAHMAGHGATWFAHYQNAGKGQRGKPWNAEPSQNIMMSTIMDTSFISIDNLFVMNMAISLACSDFFKIHAIDQTCIKWPNDIYWRDRKAGGILIENVLKGSAWRFSVVGIGLNINQILFPDHLVNPVSLKQITGKTYNPVELAKQLCKNLQYRWEQLRKENYGAIHEEYVSRLYKLNQVVTFSNQNAEFTAVVNGVNKKGELLVDTGVPTALPFGSVKWKLSS